MKSNSHLQAAHNLSPGPRSGGRAWGDFKKFEGNEKFYKNKHACFSQNICCTNDEQL